MSRAEADRLHRDAKLAISQYNDAVARKKQAERNVETARTVMYTAKVKAARAESDARKSPGGYFGEPSSLSVEVLMGNHGQSSDIIASVALASTWWRDACDFYSIGTLLMICRSHLWRQAVKAATRERVRPEALVCYGVGQLVGLMRLGSAQQASWAMQELTEEVTNFVPGYRRTFKSASTPVRTPYSSMFAGLKHVYGLMPIRDWLLAEVSGDSLQSVRMHAARLLFALCSWSNGSEGTATHRYELIHIIGTEACMPINEHGRLVRLPLPPPLVRPDMVSAAEVVSRDGPTMELTPAEVFALPDDARMYVYIHGKPLARAGHADEYIAKQCAVGWTPDTDHRDYCAWSGSGLRGWRVKLPRREGQKAKALCFFPVFSTPRAGGSTVLDSRSRTE